MSNAARLALFATMMSAVVIMTALGLANAVPWRIIGFVMVTWCILYSSAIIIVDQVCSALKARTRGDNIQNSYYGPIYRSGDGE